MPAIDGSLSVLAGIWCKQTVFELATRVPLIIRVPGAAGAASRGQKTRALVELVDMYRTMADVLTLGPVESTVEGKSFAPLLQGSPSLSHSTYAFSQYPRCAVGHRPVGGGAEDCMPLDRTEIIFMGYSVRSDTMRYSEWRLFNGTTLKSDWSPAGLKGVELYPVRVRKHPHHTVTAAERLLAATACGRPSAERV